MHQQILWHTPETPTKTEIHMSSMEPWFRSWIPSTDRNRIQFGSLRISPTTERSINYFFQSLFWFELNSVLVGQDDPALEPQFHWAIIWISVSVLVPVSGVCDKQRKNENVFVIENGPFGSQSMGFLQLFFKLSCISKPLRYGCLGISVKGYSKTLDLS